MPLNMETLTKIEYVNLSFLHPSSHLYFRFWIDDSKIS
jgi:hypothetical protein